MQPNRVSPALQDRLGEEATRGLLELVDSEMNTWGDRVLSTVANRLDAAAERHDAKLAASAERFDAKLSLAAERYERRLAEEISGLRVALVREIHEGRVEIIRWSFLFWIGQVAVIAGLFSFMLRATGH